MMPSIFRENLFDDWMDFPFGSDFFNSGFRGRKNPVFRDDMTGVMKTDVREMDQGYELAIDLPGFRKEDINARLKDGYLTISATKNEDKEEKDEAGKFIRRERYSGSMSRSFYVGEHVTEEDIQARFEDGILKLSVPKKEAKAVEEQKYIAIEG